MDFLKPLIEWLRAIAQHVATAYLTWLHTENQRLKKDASDEKKFRRDYQGFMGLSDSERADWLRKRVERANTKRVRG